MRRAIFRLLAVVMIGITLYDPIVDAVSSPEEVIWAAHRREANATSATRHLPQPFSDGVRTGEEGCRMQ